MEGLNIPLNHILLVSTLLFSIGMLGLMIRRNIIFMLILTVAAAEVAVGLGLVLQVQRRFKTLDMDSADRMRG